MIGQIGILDQEKAISNWKAQGLDFSRLFFDPDPKNTHPKFRCHDQNHYIDQVLDRKLIKLSTDAIEKGKKTNLKLPISNFNRSTGAMLSGVIAKKYGYEGLKEDTIHIKFDGTTGQAFGAVLCNGIFMEVE